jgi:hypothetical protein
MEEGSESAIHIHGNDWPMAAARHQLKAFLSIPPKTKRTKQHFHAPILSFTNANNKTTFFIFIHLNARKSDTFS